MDACFPFGLFKHLFVEHSHCTGGGLLGGECPRRPCRPDTITAPADIAGLTGHKVGRMWREVKERREAARGGRLFPRDLPPRNCRPVAKRPFTFHDSSTGIPATSRESWPQQEVGLAGKSNTRSLDC